MLGRIAFVLVLLGSAGVGAGGWIHLKGFIAQSFIAQAWQSGYLREGNELPWPWADTWPVARLVIPDIGLDQYVLKGTSGQALAFGPGMQTLRSPQGGELKIISAHRDTHFKRLAQLGQGSVLQLQMKDGSMPRYELSQIKVVSRKDYSWYVPARGQWLALVTCYPFAGLNPATELRFVVIARSAGSATQTAI